MYKTNPGHHILDIALTLLCALIFALTLEGCASPPPPAPTSPEWTRQSTRTVDNGYIVYIGIGEASSNERAQVMAEGQALEDLANECSLIPKGTRIEDRFNESSPPNRSKAYVKLAVDFQECDSAMRTNDPSEIKKIANVSFTQQLKRYQDLSETGELEAKNEVQEIQPPADIAPPPTREPQWNDSVHFYATRQYVSYQKEIVVLSPPTAYAPASPESRKFAAAVAPSSAEVLRVQEKQPTFRTQSWSHLPERPHVDRPRSLKYSAAPTAKALRPPSVAEPRRNGGSKGKGKRGRKGRRSKKDL